MRSKIEEAGDMLDFNKFLTNSVEKDIKDKENWINFFERKLDKEES